MGTLMVLLVLFVLAMSIGAATVSYRRHSRAAAERSSTAMALLMAEAYEIAAASEATADKADDAAGDDPRE